MQFYDTQTNEQEGWTVTIKIENRSGTEQSGEGAKSTGEEASGELSREKKPASVETLKETRRKKMAAYWKDYHAANKEKKNAISQAWYKANQKYLAAKWRAQYASNPEKKLAYQKAYYTANRERKLAYQKAWRAANSAKLSANRKVYLKSNKHKVLASQNKYLKMRYATSLEFKLSCILRGRVRSALKSQSAIKSNRTIELLGCSISHLRWHLESQFTEGMTWENYGKWEIDHILPCASFNILDPAHQRQCFHWTNLQPLLAIDNMRKGGKLPKSHQPELPMIY